VDSWRPPSAETAARETRSEATGVGAGQLHQQVELGRAVLEEIARAFMALKHVLTELAMVLVLQGAFARDDAGMVPGTRVELTARGQRYFAVVARTFADAPRGELILYEDSYRNVAVAVARGSAADLLGVDEGSDVTITHG